MAESMKGLKRSHRCTEVSNENIGETVTLMGWVQKRRNLGSLIFVDLRDRSGLIQLYFDEETIGEEGFKKAASLRAEFVIAVTGTVEKRSGAVNENLETGDIEVKVDSIRILSESETPPFPIDADITVKDELRLKYRFLDLRRPNIQKNLMMRSKVATLTRQFLANEGFLEIETPMLTRSTPEGARDYLVPSRVHPGSFYALPQSPQLFKQLLMCSGYDRYFQIAKCFRDEDLRADRQPEFTQIDMELSFVDVDDVIDVNERFLAYLFKEVLDVDVKLPIQRITWQEAMDRFGSDKPDMRFGMELHDVSEVVKDCGFVVFKGALEAGGSVRGINAEGQGSMPRKKIDKLVEFAKTYGAKGLAYIAIAEDGTRKSSFAKFMTEDELKAAWMYLEWMCNDDVLFTMQYGIEGENFNYNEDGLPVSVADYSGDYKQGYNSSGDYWSCETASKAAGTIEDVIYATTPHNLPQDFTQDVIDFYYARQEIAEKYAVADCLYASSMENTSEYQQTLVTLYKEARDTLTMCAPEEFDEKYQQYTDDFNDAGFADITEERKAAFEDGNTTRLPEAQKAAE